VGFPLPEVEVRVADEDGRALGPGEVGVLEVRGPNVFKGYWGLPEKTADEFRPDGFFITGDIAAIDEAGYVRIVGRAKDLIISGGFNVYPKEVELVIDELETGREGPDEAAVIGAVKEQLANYKVPKRVFFVDELPRNAMGKVQKNVLRESYGSSFSGSG
jgi:malonyl-CoA/methylmalonyl-CoA synthetase